MFQILAAGVNKKPQVVDVNMKPTSGHVSQLLHYKISDKDRTFQTDNYQVKEYFISHS
jgi:hypothetical protein